MSDPRVIWGRLRESLWFVPTLIVIAAILLAVGMVELSAAIDTEALASWPRIFGAGADGSRSMLSAIAGSMITVAGVTFSITMVAVTQASTQYSPRILRNFMRDRANQVVLGIFVGIFAYCLVVLRTIRDGEDAFVPSLAVLVGVLLAMVGIGVLIFFIHHIASTLQASEIIARIAHDTGDTVDRLYPDEVEVELPGTEGIRPLTALDPTGGDPIPALETGYIQQADIDGLVRLAEKCDLLVRLKRETGEFVVAGQPIAAFVRQPPHRDSDAASRTSQELAKKVARRFVVSTYRTLDQDVGFGLRQLVDVALKALSPGMNDTTTAVTCLDYLGALLVRLSNRRIEVEHRDAAGALRVIAAEPTFEGLLALAMDEIRQNAAGNVSVLARQLEVLDLLGGVTRSAVRRRAVARHVGLVHGVATATVPCGQDREALDARARRASAATASGA